MDQGERIEKDYQTYKLLLDLWVNENPIKTNKLQVLMVVNGLLVSAVQILGGFVARNWPIYLVACVLSMIWVFSIGRTVRFQTVWKLKMESLAERYPGDARFNILTSKVDEKRLPVWVRLAGAVSSKFYLIGAPILFAGAWFVILVISVVTG